MLTLLNTVNWPLLASAFGLCLGSLLNVVIYRLPLMLKQQDAHDWMAYAQQFQSLKIPDLESTSTRLNLFLPRSHCVQCQNNIAWYDNIPVLSWLLLRGRCRHCRVSISWRYPGVEIAIMLIALVLAEYFPPGGEWLLILAFCSLLLALAIIDYQYQLLPDNLTYSLLWLGLIWNCYYQNEFLSEAITGTIAGYMTLWLIYWAAKWLTGREGLGYGDFKLLAALGAWFGWQALPEVLLIAACATLLTLLPQRSRQQIWLQPLPFGPGLALAGGCMMFSRLALH